MIRFERTHDMRLVREIITQPSIWRHAGDDNSGPAEAYSPQDHPGFWFVLVYDGDELLGMFMFQMENSICWDVHTCLLPNALRPAGRSGLAARGMARWIFDNTPCLRITTKVPSHNRLALHFAQNAGLMEYGRNPMSWLKHGKLHDVILLGISKQEV